MSLRPWYPTIILSATTKVSKKRSELTDLFCRRTLLDALLTGMEAEEADGSLCHQGLSLLVTSVGNQYNYPL